MPSVGMRRSTRVCVPKTVGVGKGGDSGKLLRSGKRLPNNVYGDFESIKTSNKWDDTDTTTTTTTDMDVSVNESENIEDESPESDGSKFKNVYDRKRRGSWLEDNSVTSSSSQRSEDRMHGNFYVRKKKKKSRKSATVLARKLEFSNVGTSDKEVEIFWGEALPVVLAPALDVIVESSRNSTLRFTDFLVSVLRFMRSSLMTLSDLANFMCLEPIVQVFSRHGVHFKQGPRTSLPNDTISSGFCRIFGGRSVIPLVWLDFSAVPLLFRNLHSVVFLRSLYIPHVLSCSLTGISCKTCTVIEEEKNLSPTHTESVSTKTNCLASQNTHMKTTEVNGAVERRSPSRGIAPIIPGVSRIFRKKRTFRRSKRENNKSSVWIGDIQHSSVENQLKMNISCKKNHGTSGVDMFGTMDHGLPSLATTPAFYEKHTQLVPRDLSYSYKEIKSNLAESGHNMDSICCSANVLVIESDRCYRKVGGTVLLECSTSKVWHVVVKAQGLTKYMHQVHDVMRPSSTNRFTHAITWKVDNDCKLEFCDRKDWFTFKDLYKECVSRNRNFSSAKTIPVPGVREVPNYDDGEHLPFSRPDYYITVHKNEVARALAKRSANYDIELDDEEWLNCLNSGLSIGNVAVEHLSAEKFEEIIDLLEKVAYHSPRGISDEIKMTSLCSHLGSADLIAAVYQYWLKKRKQKHTPLLRVFECPPPRKSNIVQESNHRKKRSFKKQASQNGRDKCLQHFEEQEEHELKEAQIRAKDTLASAILKRKRAQKLMENADLAAYLATMALKIAETVQLANSSPASLS